MSRLAKKFLIYITTVLIFVIVLSLFLNSNFIERYDLYKKKQEINQISDQILKADVQNDEIISQLEESEDVIIVKAKSTENNHELNNALRTSFIDKGLAFEKYWLWEEDQKAAIKNGRKLRIYQQDKLHYSLMVEYLHEGEDFIAVAMIIPNMKETIMLINQVTAIVFTGATLLLIVLITVLVKKITLPLSVIGSATKEIARNNFKQIHIKTNDELEELADHINQMSARLQENQQELMEKNRQMETLLSNVSHDLKTPVALIKAYSSGIQEGIDDGTFLETIIMQNERMEQLIERLLDLSRLKYQQGTLEPVAVSDLLKESIEKYQCLIDQQGIQLHAEIADGLTITSSKEAVQSVFSNLLSNAVSYTADGKVGLSLSILEGICQFKVWNGINPETVIDCSKLWEEFYVGETSRNKTLSGTGLGLSIVRTIAKTYGFSCKCSVQGSEIQFLIQF